MTGNVTGFTSTTVSLVVSGLIDRGLVLPENRWHAEAQLAREMGRETRRFVSNLLHTTEDGIVAASTAAELEQAS